MLIGVLLPNLFGWVSNDLLFQIGNFLTYRVLLTLPLLLLIVLLYQYLSYRLKLMNYIQDSKNQIMTPQEKPTNVEIKKRRIMLLSNLAEDERETLRLFINGKKKNIRITYGFGNVSSLLENGIILLSPQVSIHETVEYQISEWAWQMLNENPQYLK